MIDDESKGDDCDEVNICHGDSTINISIGIIIN